MDSSLLLDPDEVELDREDRVSAGGEVRAKEAWCFGVTRSSENGEARPVWSLSPVEVGAGEGEKGDPKTGRKGLMDCRQSGLFFRSRGGGRRA
jgi:hypothetical protein